MKIVITHQSPDFDAVASAYGAFMLYSCDKIYLSHNVDENVMWYIKDENMENIFQRVSTNFVKDFNEEIELLVITDCKVKSRLGYLDKFIEKAKRIYVYDHHTTSECDIDVDEKFIEEVGSSTALITNKIAEKNIPLPKEGLNLMLLGIYEDTGFLTFNTTTEMDFRAVIEILKMGGDLSRINQYIKRDITKEQVFIMNELMVNMSLLLINGISVGVSFASYDDYVPDLAILANKIVDMENLDAFFMVVRLGDRNFIIARSRGDYLDTAEVIEYFGGGGHPNASSAVIKDLTLNETVEKLKFIIRDVVKPQKNAENMMTSPVKFVSYFQTFNDALELFMKYNLNMMPVVRDNFTVGLISRKDILHGIKHGLSDEPVNNIMQIEFEKVTPDTEFQVVEDLMLIKNQKLVPVEDKKSGLLGVITRTDLLRLMREDAVRIPYYLRSKAVGLGLTKTMNVRNLLKDRLPEKYYNILLEIGELGEELGSNVYVVGGFVRDLLMKNDNFDVDIVVEGGASKFARKYSKLKNARISIHKKFDTAQVILPDNTRIDFATARTEYYTFPAAAPEIESSSIKNDLYRRDFTINAMAVKLNKNEFGKLLDFFGGRKDIKDKKIRVLHNLSFVDDPSRVFRAIRFAVRFDFDIGPHTNKLLKHTVNLKLFERVIGKRMFLELKYILSEDNYLKALEMLKDYDLLKFFHRDIKLDEKKYNLFESVDMISGWYKFQTKKTIDIFLCRFYAFITGLKLDVMKNLGEKFEFNHLEQAKYISEVSRVLNVSIKIRREKKITGSKLYNFLKNFKDESIIYLGSVLGKEYEDKIKDYFNIFKNTKLEVTGDDFIKMGYKPSPKFAEILNKLIDMKLDGVIAGKEQELDMAKKLFEENM